MDIPKNFCQSCGFELDEGSTICKRCNLVTAYNLENYLLSKYKLLAVIGIFGALSVYLTTTASTHDNNQFLQYGSYLGLSIVILLSFILGWDLLFYSAKILRFQFDDEIHYWSWFKLGFRFSTLLLFMSFFAGIVGFITLYILSDLPVATTLIYAILFDFFLFLIIAVFYFPFRSLIETRGNGIRFLANCALIFLIVSSLFNEPTFTNAEFFTSIIFTFFIDIVALSLLFRSLWLMHKSMNNDVRSLTIENLKKKLQRLWPVEKENSRD